MRTLPLAAGLVAVALGLAGCSHATAGPDALASAGVATSSTAPTAASDQPLASGGTGTGTDQPVTTISGTPAPGSAAPDTPVVVAAAGVLQYLTCTGTGPPTVVVVQDLATSLAGWDDAVQQLAPTVRVCRYDRPGVGSSPPRRSPLQVVDAGLNARELSTLMVTAGVRGPYVVVGSGYGLLVARAFARLFPGSTSGLVLAGQVPDRVASQLFWTEAGHRVDIAASERAAGTAAATTLARHVLVLDDGDPASVASALPALLAQLGG